MPQIPPLPTLPLQLMLSLGCWLSSPFALQCAKSAWPPLNNKAISPAENEALQQAVSEEARNRASNLLAGILRYYDAPQARHAQEPPCIWRRGNARLLDYGSRDYRERRDYRDHREENHTTTTTATITTATMNPIVLFIPSLINRYYILDLEEERSMLRFLSRQGIYPLVLDWGEPGSFEQAFGCADYIMQILCPAIDFISEIAHQPILLAGYCMGGNMALAATQLRQKSISALALFATPWDFHCKAFLPFVVDTQWLPMIESLIAAQNSLPADRIQSLFYMTDPWVFEHKFRRFADLPPDSRAARDFVVLEHWVNDGVPMTANVARDCLIGWAQENQLSNGRWTVDGKKIDPRKLKLPTFIAIPQNDHVVPLECALPLANAMPHAHIAHPRSGHVGMIVGTHAKKELWQPFARWVLQQHP